MKTNTYIMSILVLFTFATTGIGKFSPGTAEATEGEGIENEVESKDAPTRIPVREECRNLVAVEIGGKGLLTANYERYFTPRMGIGFGLTGFGGSGIGAAAIPMYLSVNPMGDVHSLYLSIGMTLGLAVGGNDSDGTAVGTFQIGYQLQLRGGFTLRPTITCYYTDEGAFAFPGLAIGGSF